MTLLFFAGIGLVYGEDLSVSSNVRGANIAINGEDTGFRTPAVISGLSPGSVEVEVYDQCRRGSARVNVAAGEANRISVEVADQLAQLTVEVTPPQAVVDVNNGKVKLSPNVPVGLPCGTYEIKAELRGYSSVSYTLELSGGQELKLPIELDRLGVSTVEISVKPSTATILFDGKEVGRDAVSLPSVYEGEHTLSAELKGYTPVEALVVVGDGDDLVFGIELGRGERDSAVSGVGGAGRAALAEGAARRMATTPATPGPITTAKVAEPETDPLVDAGGDAPPTTSPEPAKPPSPVEPEPKVLAKLGDDVEAGVLEPEGGEDDLDEVPDEVAQPKSWSELHAESSKPAAKTTTTSQSSSKSTATKTTSSGKNAKTGMRVGGGVMLGLGAVIAGGGGYYTYATAAESYTIYAGKQEAANDAAEGGAADRLQQQADEYYVDVFQPQATLMYGAFGVGGALAATGLLLLVIDADLPVVLPTQDGAMLTWSTHF